MTQMTTEVGFGRRTMTRSNMSLIFTIGLVALIAGSLGGILSTRYMAQPTNSSQHEPLVKEMREITVSKEGLLFKTEDGTPILRLGMGEFGVYLNLLNRENRPVVRLLEDRGQGMVNVGTSVGTMVYVMSHDEGGSIIMTGKYGKQVVRLSSHTESGGGILTISEGARGNEAVEISAEKNKKRSKGNIKIFNDTGSEWEAP